MAEIGKPQREWESVPAPPQYVPAPKEEPAAPTPQETPAPEREPVPA